MAARYRLRRNWPRGGTSARALSYGRVQRGRRKAKWSRTSTIPARGRGFLRRSGYYRGRAQGCGGTELKFHDLDIDDANVAANGNIAEDSVLTVVQGDGESERIGRKLCVKKIGWRFTCELLTTATVGVSESLRVILYLDTQTNGATATVTDILETDDYQSFNNLANKGRFKIYMDRVYDLNVQAAAGDGTTNDQPNFVINDSFYKTCSIPIEYDNSAGTGAIATMRSNNIGVLLVSSVGGRARFLSKMRIRFTG